MANQINDCKFNFYTNALAKRQAPSFNGVSQYAIPQGHAATTQSIIWELDLITSQSTGGGAVVVGFGVDGDTDRLGVLMNQGGSSGVLKVESNGWTPTNGTIKVDDGLPHKIKLEINCVTGQYTLYVDGQIDQSGTHTNLGVLNAAKENYMLGRQWDGSQLLNANIYNFKQVIDGVEIGNYPMDDGWSNNPTMRNIGTGADGAFINMTEAAWVEIDA